jgi:hypothetical protein
MQIVEGLKWARASTLATILAVCCVTLVAAQERTIRAFPAKASKVPLYSEADTRKPAGEIDKSALDFPVRIIERDGDFAKIDTGRGTFWVDISRADLGTTAVKSECSPMAANRKTLAGSRAASDACTR